jgi:ATP-dependent RNA helicase RhlE
LTQTFSELGLSARLVSALAKAGMTIPTPIQRKAIGPQLQGRDIMGIAQTGSGKTAAFGLPLLSGLAELKDRPRPLTTRALILAPTRELAVQIEQVLRSLSAGMTLSTVLVLGGMSRHAQVTKIARGVDVVIATPGRLKDLIDDKKLKLNETRWLILDEADRMLDMGFIVPVKAIAAAIGPRRQTAMFSATMGDDVAKLAKGLLNDPVRVEASAPATPVGLVTQRAIAAGSKEKRDRLNELLADAALSKVIIFSRTKHGADRVSKNLVLDGHQAAAIHGNKSQNARQAALTSFTNGKVRILVATDIAARGIDVPNITHVINYELPDDPTSYVHRIGRTARNGASGVAITLVGGDEAGKLRDVERLIGRTLPVEGTLRETSAAEPTKRRGAPPPRGGKPNPRSRHNNGPRREADAGHAGKGPRRGNAAGGAKAGKGPRRELGPVAANSPAGLAARSKSGSGARKGKPRAVVFGR